MKTLFVVTGIVKNKDKFLIVKKSSEDQNYPNRWSFCSGFVKEHETAENACMREIKEETGLDCKINTGEVMEVLDEEKDINWIIAVYLCTTNKTDVKLCSENVDHRWVSADEFKDYEFVPGLTDSLKKLDLI
ncbi:MAG: NUDIX domain-containing protein [Nanoarchaeota archaeon]